MKSITTILISVFLVGCFGDFAQNFSSSSFYDPTYPGKAKWKGKDIDYSKFREKEFDEKLTNRCWGRFEYCDYEKDCVYPFIIQEIDEACREWHGKVHRKCEEHYKEIIFDDYKKRACLLAGIGYMDWKDGRKCMTPEELTADMHRRREESIAEINEINRRHNEWSARQDTQHELALMRHNQKVQNEKLKNQMMCQVHGGIRCSPSLYNQ